MTVYKATGSATHGKNRPTNVENCDSNLTQTASPQTASPHPNCISFSGLSRVTVWVKRPYFNVNFVLKRLLTSYISTFRS